MAHRGLIVGLAGAFLAVPSLWAGLEELARSEDWARVLQVASRRADQLPLSQGEALIAARAARSLGDRESERRFLGDVVVGGDERLARLAEVQLAELVRTENPDPAVELVLPSLRKAPSWQVREAATESATEALAVGVKPEQRQALEGAAPKLPRSLRRRLELGLALGDDQRRRQRLERLLAASTGDLVALEAAAVLREYDPMSPVEQWRVAKTLYRHALYTEAEPLLEDLDEVRHTSVPREEVAYLRGRCAFRQDRWAEAISWYRKAIARARGAERRAELEVHLGRSYELNGQMDEAVAAAQRAVRLKTTDDRRLFLARLRLRRDEPELAAQGISHLRGRSARARGELMLGMDSLRHDDRSTARHRLESVRRRPWAAPAAVLAAELAAGDGAAEEALNTLERTAKSLGPFWGAQARGVMASLPEPLVDAWRQQRRTAVEGAEGGSLWRALGRWAVLEPDRAQLQGLCERVASKIELAEQSGTPPFAPGLAGQLWGIGLEREAVRWDPSGMPRGDAAATAWSADRLLAFGLPWRALRAADGAWRQAGAEVPVCAFPESFRRTLYPLPEPALVKGAAADGRVPWPLLAAVAREESRWDPGARSAVGARGLVQLMPATASTVAANLGAPPPSPEDLFDPGLNLRLGAAELGRLLRTFSGRHAPAVAAYNAGEAQARLWLDQCGASCTDKLYLMNISFSATRAYTAAVLASAASYDELYRQEEEAGVAATPPPTD